MTKIQDLTLDLSLSSDEAVYHQQELEILSLVLKPDDKQEYTVLSKQTMTITNITLIVVMLLFIFMISNPTKQRFNYTPIYLVIYLAIFGIVLWIILYIFRVLLFVH